MLRPNMSYAPLPPDAAAAGEIFIATCGYEARARYIASSVDLEQTKVYAYTYPQNRVHNFDENLRFFESVGSVSHPESLTEFKSALKDDLERDSSPTSPLRVTVDISSFCRERIAGTLVTLAELASKRTLEVVFLYSLATFDSHHPVSPATVMVNAPLKGFEGWTGDPSLPVACILGLGFEDQIALAALETLEPTHTFAFVASNPDSRFNDRVQQDNRSLIDSADVTRLDYELNAPFDALHAIEAVVHAIQSSHRIAFVPLGPKPFAFLSMLIALDYQDQVSVWRVSASEDDPQDRIASGEITGLVVTLTPGV